MPGPGNLTLGGGNVLCRPTNVYAGADRICASLLDPNTVGIVYSFGAFTFILQRGTFYLVSRKMWLILKGRISFASNVYMLVLWNENFVNIKINILTNWVHCE